MSDVVHVFVSHSHKDEDLTQRLVIDLHQAGAEVWVDTAGLDHGNFMQRIDEALARCQWLVLVLTPNAITSEYVKQEVYAALLRVNQGFMRAVIPMLAAPCSPGTIPPQWDALQRYDATQDYAGALSGLMRAMGLSLASQAPSSSPSDRGQYADMLAQGQALMKRRQFEEAVPFFQVAATLGRGKFDPWFYLASALLVSGRSEEALAACERALSIDPNNAEAWNHKGVALGNLDRRKAALEAFDRALELKPQEALFWCNKGDAYLALDWYKLANEAFDKALLLNSSYSRAWAGKAVCLRYAGETSQARAAERRAKELDG